MDQKQKKNPAFAAMASWEPFKCYERLSPIVPEWRPEYKPIVMSSPPIKEPSSSAFLHLCHDWGKNEPIDQPPDTSGQGHNTRTMFYASSQGHNTRTRLDAHTGHSPSLANASELAAEVREMLGIPESDTHMRLDAQNGDLQSVASASDLAAEAREIPSIPESSIMNPDCVRAVLERRIDDDDDDPPMLLE